MVYKNGPRFKIRPVEDIKTDLSDARKAYGSHVRTLFFPAGNTIAMPTADLAALCHHARKIFPSLERITVYGSSQYIHQKGPADLKRLAEAGLSRIHVGLESGDDVILKHICKGTRSRQQIEAGCWVLGAGLELSVYVILGIGGKLRTFEHAHQTANVLNQINPTYTRLRTFVPKINTSLLAEVQQGTFQIMGPHEVLEETARLIHHTHALTYLTSDHYTNYLNLEGQMPDKKQSFMVKIHSALKKNERSFRPFFIGTQ
jgi:radical SAM superfamily enzyme YgiQ (UPF0313 family)